MVSAIEAVTVRCNHQLRVNPSDGTVSRSLRGLLHVRQYFVYFPNVNIRQFLELKDKSKTL